MKNLKELKELNSEQLLKEYKKNKAEINNVSEEITNLKAKIIQEN